MSNGAETILLGTLLSTTALSANAQEKQSSDRTKTIQMIRSGIHKQKYTEQSLSLDGNVFIGTRENGIQETRTRFETSNQGPVAVRIIGDTIEVSTENYRIKSLPYGYQGRHRKIEYKSKEGTAAYTKIGNKFISCAKNPNDFASAEIAAQFDFNPYDAENVINQATQYHNGFVTKAQSDNMMREIVDLTAQNKGSSLQLTPNNFRNER